MSKKFIIAIVGFFVFVLLYVMGYNYLTSVPVSVSVENGVISSVRKGDSVLYSGKNNANVNIRVPEYTKITVLFDGKDGYESSSRVFEIANTQKNIVIKPYYSSVKLKSILEKEKPAIEKSIQGYSPNIPVLYNLTEPELYHYGDWCIVTLKWLGAYSENSDSLRTILKKTDGEWSVVGPPGLLFYDKHYPDIPTDILEKANSKMATR